MQNATLRIFKKDGKKVSGKCGGILLILKLIIGLFPVLQRRVAFLALFACSFPPLYADHESENVGPGANLSGADLSGDNLFGANLSNADLSNANLTGTNLEGALLSNANLTGANLTGTNLTGAVLTGADLSSATVSDATKISLPGYWIIENDKIVEVESVNVGPGADLSGADLSGDNLFGANLSNADLSNANLTGTNLEGALLSNANLTGANLTGTNLTGAVLTGADLSLATVSDATKISLPGYWIIENNRIVEVDFVPELVSELPDITATEDGPDVLIDLGPVFKDANSADDAAMSYAVTENTNGAMVTTSVNTDVFILKGSYQDEGGAGVGGSARKAVVEGSYAYVAVGHAGLKVVNVGDPESPTLAGNYDPSWDIQDVAISGGYAYLANDSGGVRIVSLAEPSNPTEVAQYDTAGSARGIDVSGNYAYVADGASGLVILDVSSPSNPVLVGTSNTPDFAYRVDVEGGHAYVADRAGGLQIVDISTPSSPQIVGSYSTQAGSNWNTGAAWDVKVEGDYAYVAASGAGLIIVDVSNPANPVLEGSHSTNVSDARGVYVLSGKAYLASSSSGLFVIDVTSPPSPVLVGTYDSTGSAMGVTAVGDYAYLADWGGGLKIVDTTYLTDELALSFEPNASGSADITVTATSGADMVSDTFNITIANVNDAPQFNNGSGGPFGDEWEFTIGEDALVDAVVGTVTATDFDGDTLTYNITDGNEGGLFAIDPSSGEIKVAGVLDHETAPYHSLKVQAADAALSAITRVRVSVSNVPEITLAGNAVVTIELGGTYTQVSATSDGGETVAVTGTVNTSKVGTYTITYSAMDGSGNKGTATRTVNVVDTTKPVITSGGLGISLFENSGSGQSVYTIAASDASGVVSYVIGGTDAASLTLNGDDVSLIANPDYEAKNSYSFTVTASDAAGNPSDPTTVTFSIIVPIVKNTHAIQIDANTNIALDSTVGGVGDVWSWYSNGVASDPSNSLSVFLASVRNAITHRMDHSASDPGSLSQTSGTGTNNYSYPGIPNSGNDESAKGVVLQYTAIEERELLIETTGGAYNDSVVVIFTEAHLNGGSAPFRVVTMDSGDETTFKVKFPYFTDNPDGNIYYIALTSYNSSDLGSDTPLRITASDIIDDLGYTTTEGKVTITDCDEAATGEIVIPPTIEGKTVTSIGNEAFKNCTDLTSITIPDSVTSIGNGAFNGCTSLTSITIPDDVTSIGDYVFQNCTSLTSITIPDNVTSIGDYVFQNCTSLTSITIPDNVTSIGESAFGSCTDLTSITIPDSVTSIGNGAFYGCTSLTSITIPDSVTSIGEGVFQDCSSLTSITIPDGVTSIGDYAFAGCTSLTSITIPDNVTSIGEGAFAGCTSLTSITIGNGVTSIGNGVTSIGDYAFAGCTSLTSITIPDNVTSIGEGAFAGCTSLTSITIPDNVTSIGEGAFARCTSVTSITIPDSVTSIGDGAFYSCTSLTSITIPDGVTSIGGSAFYSCTSLTSITIGNGVTSIGNGAFSYCSNLTSITIPDSVTSIGNKAFEECTSLASITFLGTAPTVDYLAFANLPNGAEALVTSEKQASFGDIGTDWNGLTLQDLGLTAEQFVAAAAQLGWLTWTTTDGKVTITDCDEAATGEIVIPPTIEGKTVTSIGNEAFKNCTDLTSITIPDSVTSIGNGAFFICTSLTSITIPDSVTSIGEGVFQNCTSLTSITIPDSVTSIGDGAFEECTSLASITIPDNVTSIGGSAFYSCTSLTSITIPNSVTSIGYGAFYYCTSLTSITIPDSVTSIGEGVFEECASLTSITIPDSVTSIGDYAFAGCTSLTSITIPDSVTSIGDGAFEECTSLASITIPDSVTSIGEDVFQNCSNLTSITIGNGVKSIGDSAFFACNNLTSITIPDSVTTIWGNAFAACTSLTSITIPDSVTSIGDYAFAGCTSLTSITIPDSVTSIGDGAFSYCSNLTSITIPDSVTSVGNKAFEECTSIASITFLGTAPTVGYLAFANLPNGAEAIVTSEKQASFGDIGTDWNGLTLRVTEDTTLPVITVTSGTDTVEQGATWTDAGATADTGETVIASGTVDTTTVGTYRITYTATDAAENIGTATRTVTVVGSGGGESFGDVVIYPNNSAQLIGQVTIEGEAAESGDVLAIYVGSELRGKGEVIMFEGNAWVNVLVNSAGENETISFKVYDASAGVIHEKSKTSAVITSEGVVGSFANPLIIKMKDFEIQTLNLKEGWNLVSLYVEAYDMTTSSVLSPIQDKLLQVKDLTQAYDPSVPAFLNTLSSLSVKDGYWLEVSEDVSLDVEGPVLSGASINVKSGWNLVGYPRLNGEEVASELTSLGNSVVEIKNLVSVYTPSAPPYLNTLSTMVPGSGYWLNVSQAGTWELGSVEEVNELDFATLMTGPGHLPEEKVGPPWGDVVVSPNLGATVLAEVSIQGKPVAMGSVVGVFVGNELRGLQEVVLADGISYATLVVNLNGVEEVSYRVWNPNDNNEYLVSGVMPLELGMVYGNPEPIELNAIEVVVKPLQVFNVTREPFGFSFNTMVGRNYTVEATSDFRTWEAVESFQGSGGEIRFAAEPTSSRKRQFFRVYAE